MISKNKNFLIVGLGLMGGSYAERLSENSYKVFALDVNKESIEIGKKRKIILNKDESDEELIKNADYIILAILPSICHSWVKEHKHLFKKEMIMTDMMGVKSFFVDDIQNELEDNEFISMHPMTGKELSGVSYSSSNIFNSSNMLIVPTMKNTPRGKEFAYDLAKILNVKNVKEVSIEEHDKVVGYVSHLSHVISVVLMNCFEAKSIKEIAGTSFKDITRIANINENIWSELFLENKKELIPLIDSFKSSLEDIENALREDDEEKIKEILKQSRIKRQSFNE